MNVNTEEIAQAIEATKARSAWERGVKIYAAEIVEDVAYLDDDDLTAREFWKALLNGAQTWREFSYGGCSLIYDEDIAERLCNPTELKRTNGGRRNPNSRESWLDVQARALYQASHLARRVFEQMEKREH